MLSNDQVEVVRTWAATSPDAEWVTGIWLFGSRARGDHRPDSDVDLGFDLRDEPGRTAEGEAICMRQRWCEALTERLGLRADVWWANDPESEIVAPGRSAASASTDSRSRPDAGAFRAPPPPRTVQAPSLRTLRMAFDPAKDTATRSNYETAREAVAVATSDSTDLTKYARALFVGVGGDVALVPVGQAADTAVVFKNVPNGAMLLVQCRRVYATGTTATSILALN